MTLKGSRTAVPGNKTTTYVCQVFDVPDDREYHLFATKPEIDNRNVMHHMIVWGCPGDQGKLLHNQILLVAGGCRCVIAVLFFKMTYTAYCMLLLSFNLFVIELATVKLNFFLHLHSTGLLLLNASMAKQIRFPITKSYDH